MENKMDMAMRIMNDVRASGAKMDTMDDMYAVVSNYVQLSKEQFVEAYNKANEELESELSDAELDMVVGGGVGDFFKDHWKEILIATGIVLLTAATCAGLTAGLFACSLPSMGGGSAAMAFLYGAETAAAATGVASAATTTAVVSAGVVGGVLGIGVGAGIAYNVLN